MKTYNEILNEKATAGKSVKTIEDVSYDIALAAKKDGFKGDIRKFRELIEQKVKEFTKK